MKKTISILLTLSIIVSLAFSSTYVSAENILSADADGVLWIEESDYETYENSADGVLSTRVGTNGTTQATADMMSGGDAYWAWWGGVTYTSMYKVNAAKAGTYKLWYRGSDPTGAYHDKSKITVNGTEVTVTKVTGTDFTATIDPSGTKKTFSCAWFVAEVNLASGVNTIGYNVTEKATSGQKYACLFDCMVLAPANYEWASPSNSTRPKKAIIELNKNEVKWIQESDNAGLDFGATGMLAINYDVRVRGEAGENGTTVAIADSMSGGNAHWLASSGFSYTATYKVKAPSAGTYKLWYRGSDPSNGVHDKSKIKVNGTQVSITKIKGTDFTVTMDPNSPKNYACAWFVAEVTLTGGVDIITYEVLEKSSGASNRRMFFDCFVLAPSLYNWVTPTISSNPAISLYFSLEGNMEIGDSFANATVTLNDRVGDLEAVVITALYDADNTLKYFKQTPNTFTDINPSVNINLELTSHITAGDTLRVFLWDSMERMIPLSSTLTLTVDSVVGNVVGFAEDGVAWIEESDFYEALSGSETTGDIYANGMASYAWFTSSQYHTTFKLNAPEAGTYKIWYRGSDPANPYHDKSKIYVNGTEAEFTKIANTTFATKVENNRTLSCAWFVAEVTLDTGINTIEYQVKETSTNGNRYACLLDCMVVAPSSYKWALPSNTTRPLGSIVGQDKLIEFAEDGVCWIEDSEFSMFDSGTNEPVLEVSDESMSGGKAQYSFNITRSHHSTYKVNAETAGTYKLWYRGSDPNEKNHDKSKILVNGIEIAVAKVTNTGFTATVETGKNVACAWFLAEVTLNEGENVIEYKITETSTNEVLGQYRYVGLLDCFVLAPTTYEWLDPTISTRPAEPEVGPEGEVVEFDADGIAWIEESDNSGLDFGATGMLAINYDVRARGEAGENGTTVAIADSMSGGNAHWLASGGFSYTATYDVKAPAAGTYKLWYRGSDPTNGYHDKTKIKVNGTEVSITKITGTDFTVNMDPTSPKNYACAWFVAEVTLTGGVDTITYEVLEKSSSATNRRMFFDCFVLAPSNYEWDEPTIDTKPSVYVEPETGVTFDADGVCWIEESDNSGLDFGKDGMKETDYDLLKRAQSSDNKGNTVEFAQSMSGGNAHWLASGGFTYTATYEVKAPEAGTYKLWYLGSDPTNTYHDKSKIKVNGTEVAITKVPGTDFTVTVDPSGTKKNYACAWFVAEVTLTGGVDTITYEVLDISSGATNRRMFFDCFVLAPSTYVWATPTISTRPTAE